jgi:hypothetical protein
MLGAVTNPNRPNANVNKPNVGAADVSAVKWSALDLARGVSRLLLAEGYSTVTEFTLANGRRLDVAAINPKGEILGVEIKVSLTDLRGDKKWPDYKEFCDFFYFAVPPEFPRMHVPGDAGQIIADSYGGAIIRDASHHTVHASRRRAVTLRFAQCAADRLARLRDPNPF